MNETYVIDFAVREGQRERFLALLNPVLDAMRHEATFVAATLHTDPEDPHHFLLHETWSDRQDVVEVQLKRSYRDPWHAALPGLLDRPRAISTWIPLRSDPPN